MNSTIQSATGYSQQKIILVRESNKFYRSIPFKVYLDQSKIGTLSSGETIELNLPKGEHSLELVINWLGSKTFWFHPSAGKSFRIKISRLFIIVHRSIFITLFLNSLHGSLDTSHRFDLILIIIDTIVLISIIYFFSIGRNRVIEIEEVE